MTLEWDMNSLVKRSLGWALIVTSFVLWGIIALLPFLGLTGAGIAAITTGLVIFGEITFWLGLLLVGRQAWDKMKYLFSKIFRTLPPPN